jgi:LuxR family transcriptional regulator, maltose regulon positive regulatory protein
MRHPGLDVLGGQDLQAEPSPGRDPFALAASALTAAELRLLPMLSTHLSFPEIAEEMFLSRHTVKSHAASIYRKLGASSRSQAVTQSRNLGLLDRLGAGISPSPRRQDAIAGGAVPQLTRWQFRAL